MFFVASAAASSAYLTVSELFPVELRGMAIAVFYAFGTLVGAGAPTLFGAHRRHRRAAAAARRLRARRGADDRAAVVARALGVDAEGRSLEELTADDGR